MLSRQEPQWFGLLATSMGGASDESSIRSDTIGKSASPCQKALERRCEVTTVSVKLHRMCRWSRDLRFIGREFTDKIAMPPTISPHEPHFVQDGRRMTRQGNDTIDASGQSSAVPLALSMGSALLFQGIDH